MHPAEILSRGHSKALAMQVVKWVGNDAERFAELVKIFLGKEVRLSQRAAMSVMWCADRNPELIKPWIGKFVERLGKAGNHSAIDRNIVRILQFMDIPEKYEGKLADKCFCFLQAADTPIAVRAFAMTVVFNIVKKYPEMAHELEVVLREWLPNASAGEANRAGKILVQIEKLRHKHIKDR
ncbi:MAG: hypothetical protein MUC87_13020 [Bacteroidia bacterium]|jgi:hypothetical protein|nr:hypothetical protein [Bacteroidia bacterium]